MKSIIVALCEDPCPLPSNAVCCRAAGHEPPHRTMLIRAYKDPAVPRGHITIEWREARADEDWSSLEC